MKVEMFTNITVSIMSSQTNIFLILWSLGPLKNLTKPIDLSSPYPG